MVLQSAVRIGPTTIGSVDIQRMTRGPDGGLPLEGQLCRYRWEVVVGARGERDRLRAQGELDHPYSYDQGAWLNLYVIVLVRAGAQLGLPVLEEAHG